MTPPADHGSHVVDVAVVEADGAAGMGAGAVHRPQRSALLAGGDPLGAPDVEGDAVTVEHDRDDVGLQHSRRIVATGTASPVEVSHTELVVQPVTQRVEVDQHRHLGHAATRRRGRR